MSPAVSRMIVNVQLAVILMTGVICLTPGLGVQPGPTVQDQAFQITYGTIFLLGPMLYWYRPFAGSVLLVVTLLSICLVAPFCHLSLWIDASDARRVGLIIGAILTAGIVSDPLVDDAEPSADHG
ncbi:MAG: hypothetical protein GC159_04845 [Phycisphaera sp.]|nr:hypothetical protein [Phycisphaera sp.]